MSENAPKSASQRQRACRERKRASGAPLTATFDRALREVLFASYQAGDLSIDIPEAVRKAMAMLTASNAASDRGCRAVVQTLLARAARPETGHD